MFLKPLTISLCLFNMTNYCMATDSQIIIINNSTSPLNISTTFVGNGWDASKLNSQTIAANVIEYFPLKTNYIDTSKESKKGLSFNLSGTTQFGIDIVEWLNPNGYLGNCHPVWGVDVTTTQGGISRLFGDCGPQDYTINVRVSKDGKNVTIANPIFNNKGYNYNIRFASAASDLKVQNIYIKSNLDPANTDYYPLNNISKSANIVEPNPIENIQLDFEAVTTDGAKEQKQVNLKLVDSYCTPTYTLTVTGNTKYQNCVFTNESNKEVLLTMEQLK